MAPPQKRVRAKCSTAVFPKMFKFRKQQSQVSPVPKNYNVTPIQLLLHLLVLPLYIINSLEVDEAAMFLI
jgi:hypothetical protein